MAELRLEPRCICRAGLHRLPELVLKHSSRNSRKKDRRQYHVPEKGPPMCQTSSKREALMRFIVSGKSTSQKQLSFLPPSCLHMNVNRKSKDYLLSSWYN
jgi:hypothetical protein